MVFKESKSITVENNLLVKLDEAITFSFYALIFFLPISIALVGTCAAFVIFFYLIKKIILALQLKKTGLGLIWYIFKPTPSFLDWPMASFVGAVFLSVIFSQYHGLSVNAFFGKILRGVYLFSAFIDVFTTRQRIIRFLFVWFTSACVTALSGMSQYFGGVDFLRHTFLSDGRVSSSLRQANDFGAYLVTIIPVLIIFLLNRHLFRSAYKEDFKKTKISYGFMVLFLFVSCFLLLYCLGLTLSRASWGAFCIALFTQGLLNRKHFVWLFCCGVFLVMIFSSDLLKVRNMTLINDTIAHSSSKQIKAQEIKKDGWIQYRLDHMGSGRWGFWKEAIDMIGDYPVWGAGLNTYSVMGSRYKISWGGYPHNSYLQMCAEIGFLGLGSFLWLVGLFFKEAYFFIKKNIDTYLGILFLGVCGGLLAYLIQSTFDTTFYSVQLSVLFWLVFALAVSLMRLRT